jgi:5-methyltetrahydrofolate--homocysteine methyltransferase
MRTPARRHVPKPLIVGERINAQGSRAVKRLLLAGDYDGIAAIARDQLAAGAHILDVCVASPEIVDEAAAMSALVSSLSARFDVPLMIDSIEPTVIAGALAHLPARAYINSISLARGRAGMDAVLPVANACGAAVVALTIDETGAATTSDRKLAIARRIVDIAVGEYGMPAEAVFVDPLTFTLGAVSSATETIEGIRAIKRALPGVGTILGVSNVSFGLPTHVRPILNSVFLQQCVRAGLDAAIVDPAQVSALAAFAEHDRRLAEELILDGGPDALRRFIAR